VIGPAIREGLQQGRQEGLQRGRQEVLHSLLERRFGQLPDWVEERLAGLSPGDLDGLVARILEAGIEELFPAKK
jgi:Domain of unknown function (DUF4351)